MTSEQGEQGIYIKIYKGGFKKDGGSGHSPPSWIRPSGDTKGPPFVLF